MRIAIDIRKIGKKSTGDETVFYYLVKELAKLQKSKKHNFLLLTDEDARKAEKILAPLPDNFQIHQITPAAKLFWTFYSLPKFLGKNPVDLLHVQYTVPFHLTRKIKVITTIHDVSFRVNPAWIRKIDSFLLNRALPPSLRRADGVITVSEFSKKEIMKYYRYPGNKIFVTHPAVDDRYFGLTSSKDAKKTVAGIIGGDFPFILHLSSLQPRKNVPLIVAAFARLKESNGSSLAKQNDLKLVIVGDRSGYNYDKKIEEEIANQIRNGNLKKGDVIITGYQPKEILPYFYKAAKIFVFPSVYEGFGIPLLEAMVSKTPVIASNVGSLKEVGGKAPIYINLEDEERADKIREAMEDLLENDARKAKKISLGLEQAKRFSWKKLAEKTMEVYESILSV